MHINNRFYIGYDWLKLPGPILIPISWLTDKRWGEREIGVRNIQYAFTFYLYI